MPAGEEVTVPVPVPAFVTFRLFCCIALKLALIVWFAVTFVKL
jgi:hypothetical protein